MPSWFLISYVLAPLEGRCLLAFPSPHCPPLAKMSFAKCPNSTKTMRELLVAIIFKSRHYHSRFSQVQETRLEDIRAALYVHREAGLRF